MVGLGDKEDNEDLTFSVGGYKGRLQLGEAFSFQQCECGERVP